jgi:hypothetical protein
MRFLGRAESIGPMWSKPKQSKVKTNPGTEPTASRWSGPLQAKERAGRINVPLIVRDEFRTGYSSIGLLASRARLRFTGTARIKRWTVPTAEIIIER